VIRRTTHTPGLTVGLVAGLVAVALLSSCSSPSSPGRDVVASANGTELSRTMLAHLLNTSPGTGTPAPPTSDAPPTSPGAVSADATRTVMTQWLQIAAVGHDMNTITDGKTLEAEALNADLELATPFLGQAADLYAKGFDGSPKVCLGAIPLAAETDPNVVLDALANGASLAEAASKYSNDPTFVRSGGVLEIEDGDKKSTCIESANLNPDVVTQMSGAKPGEPKPVTLGNTVAIVVIRPFDTLRPAEQLSVSPDVQQQVADERNSRLAGADIFVDKRYGRWESDSSSVVPLVAG
jgi:hypothetical protein